MWLVNFFNLSSYLCDYKTLIELVPYALFDEVCIQHGVSMTMCTYRCYTNQFHMSTFTGMGLIGTSYIILQLSHHNASLHLPLMTLHIQHGISMTMCPYRCCTNQFHMSTFTGMGLIIMSNIILQLSHHNASLIANTCH